MMEQTEKLEKVIGYYRQNLADEQLITAQLNVRIDELNEHIEKIERELEEYRVQTQTDPTDNPTGSR